MTSAKHAVKRRVHLERATPSSKAAHGPIENRDQFLQRARIAKKNKEQLAELERKAAMKNPNEFNFGMLRSVKKKGCIIARKDSTASSKSNRKPNSSAK